MPTKTGTRPASYLTTAEFSRLNHACLPVAEAFGGHCYLVGSSLERDDYRDLDVRVILADEEFDRTFPNVRVWSLLCLSVTEYLQRVSGLPVDFQVQRMTEANERHQGSRNPIGTRARWFAGGGDATSFNAASDHPITDPLDSWHDPQSTSSKREDEQ